MDQSEEKSPSAGEGEAERAERPGETEQAGGTELNETIAQLCRSKAEEFRLIGYEQVTGEDVWECVSDKYHKKGTPPLYAVVNDILSLKVTQFMNFITLNMYRGEYRK
ncbi:post-transcriptional regulator [Paenibacillaceae bacterium WGS1546]|uniref:post-transcriptional regulator n=1 Tax=Cohnella sp. WGS1546 TaxID=3366810 RepID=UPI00372D092E